VRPRARLARNVLAGTAAGVLLAGCHVPGFATRAAADKQGQVAASLWRGVEITALVVGVIVWGLILYVVVRYRKRRTASEDAIPSQRAYIVPLEIIYSVVPLVIVAVLFGFTVVKERQIQAVSAHPQLTVQVTAFQWGWRFVYPDGGPEVVSEPNQAPPELVLPDGQTTEIDLTATDVVHAFFVPAFLFQRNAQPGQLTRFDLTPTTLGTFDGHCSTFCGIGHAQMLFTVRVVSPADFATWLRSGGPAGP
jgi:cytochrome c oxidase subunit II